MKKYFQMMIIALIVCTVPFQAHANSVSPGIATSTEVRFDVHLTNSRNVTVRHSYQGTVNENTIIYEHNGDLPFFELSFVGTCKGAYTFFFYDENGKEIKWIQYHTELIAKKCEQAEDFGEWETE
ncbi:hypothetical protein ACFSCX_15815 [Bacillus salitolerans]|uniref:Uncharacterized protein n=1 Tax=Bacillus salitolerans TaxID=1437434 RepID=A0ABW4LS61_9BACI